MRNTLSNLKNLTTMKVPTENIKLESLAPAEP